MKKIFKLFIVMLCILMIFASCTSAPEVKLPSADIVGKIEGSKTNSDGTITLPGAGVVVNKDGSIAGKVANDGCSLVTPSGVKIEGREISEDEDILLEAVTKRMGGSKFHGACKEDTTPEGRITAVLTKEIEIDGITYHAFFSNSDENAHEFTIFVSFSVEGKKHTYIANNGLHVIDGDLVYFGPTNAGPNERQL